MKPKLRAWLHPDSACRLYKKILIDYSKAIISYTTNAIEGRAFLRTDGWSDDVTVTFLDILAHILGISDAEILKLPDIYAAVNKFNDQQWRLMVNAGTGINIATGAGLQRGLEDISQPSFIKERFGAGVDVYRSEPWLKVRQENWVAQNTRLIKSISNQYTENVEGIIRRGVLNGTSPKTLAEEIKIASNVTRHRALIIATDQIGKANGELTRFRQMDLGVEEYEWITSHDERVRPRHRLNSDKIFKWSSPPEGGHPGYPVKCRCYASPIFKE